MKIVIIGAGPVGALAALYAARRGHEVELYEMRADLSTSPSIGVHTAKSINLTLSERGLHAISQAGSETLLQTVLADAVQVYGRMVHTKSGRGKLGEKFIRYDIHGRPLHVVDRERLNEHLLEALKGIPNVKVFLRHKLLSIDFTSKTAEFQTISTSKNRSSENGSTRGINTVHVQFDLVIGADGAHSATRAQLARRTRMNITQTWFDIQWCEISIPRVSGEDSNPYRLSSSHLHVWPQRDFMFIALPDVDGTFTCNLFAPEWVFRGFEERPSTLVPFFQKHFPGVVPNLLDPESLEEQFLKNPHSSLLDIRCSPYHLEDCGIIIGDAAHAMVPFYGQGLNTGLEDVRVLFENFLDKASPPKEEALSTMKRVLPGMTYLDRSHALAQYSKTRQLDLHVINELALANYRDMRTGATSYTYRSRKWIEEHLSLWVPWLGWATLYHRVAFENVPYSQVRDLAKKQGRILGVMAMGLLVMLVGLALWLVDFYVLRNTPVASGHHIEV